MTPQQLKRKISRFPSSSPVTDRFEASLTKRGEWTREGVWYASQKQHWMGWLSEYEGPGAYGRKGGKGRTAEYAYNHIVCPPMLLWLAEAAGVEKRTLEAARRRALAAPAALPSKCSAVRNVIPWSKLAPLLDDGQSGSDLGQGAARPRPGRAQSNGISRIP
jgi:hypothetical protein